MSLYRFVLVQACLCLWASAAQSVSLDVAGSPDIAEMVCPKFVASTSTGHTPGTHEEQETPSLEDLEGVMDLPDTNFSQHIRLNSTHRSTLPSIGIWGDSHLAAAFFTDELVNLLGLQNSDVKPGFLPPTMGRGGVRLPIRKYCKSPGWRLTNAYASREEMLKFGPALTALENTRDDVLLWIDFRYPETNPALEQVTIHFKEPGDQSVVLEVGVDDGPPHQVVLEKGETALQLKGSQPFSQLRLQVIRGEISIEGFSPIYVSPARLRLDVFGIPGATAHGWNVADPEYLRKKLNNFDYDLIIFEYGTNEGADRNFDADKYLASLTDSLHNIRVAFPDSQCILIGPTDRGVFVKTRAHATGKNKLVRKSSRNDTRRALTSKYELLRYANIHARIAEVQMKLARTNGCEFWDWQKAMGGLGSAYKWFYKTPPFMAKDLIHLTRAGYKESARKFVDDTEIRELLK